MIQNHPRDFLAAGWHIGVKAAPALDFGAVFSLRPATAAAVFTRNNFPGHPVTVGRERVRDGRLQALLVNSGNSNVATGPAGLALVHEYCAAAAQNLGIDANLILPSSTGVIGRPMPREALLAGCAQLKEKLIERDFDAFAEAIRTTDAYRKMQNVELMSGARITGVCKGAGMIEPNMATMLAYVFTDAALEPADADRLWRAVVNRSFNRISVDSDTSTSDTALLLANGGAGVRVSFTAEAAAAFERLQHPIRDEDIARLPGLDGQSREFVSALLQLCQSLARMIVADGEGATKTIEVRVTEARDRAQALKIARSIVNSPLVKTAVYGADPNWGRLVMAVGKVFDEPVQMEKLRIFFGDRLLNDADPEMLSVLSNYLKNQDVVIRVSLGQGEAWETVWGCDLTEDYVKLNAEYTT